jgi:3',5'-cyclic AMP phosphodiesterase CpdA
MLSITDMNRAFSSGRLLGVLLGLWLLMSAGARAAEPFLFIQLSDTQYGMFTGDREFVQESANHEFAVATINRLKPAFVVVTGDLVNKPGDAAQIAEYRRIQAKIDPAIRVYDVAGNHDVENVPTLKSIAAYTNVFGPDYYSFKHGGFVGIVLNSSVIHSPQKTPEHLEAQERWLVAELEKARAANARHIAVFQHHPWCIASATETNQYFNIPIERRAKYLAWFHKYGVRYTFCGHYHRNAFAKDGALEVVTTGPVGKPLGRDQSGLRLAIVREDRVEHRYYELGTLPTQIDLKAPLPVPIGK